MCVCVCDRRLVPNAVCIVVNGENKKGVHLPYNEDPRQPGQWPPGWRGDFLEVPPGESQAAAGITKVDSTWGLNRAIVMVGYGSLGRNVSIRSDKRCLTHIIARYGAGKVAADQYQLMLRGDGRVWEVRQTAHTDAHTHIHIHAHMNISAFHGLRVRSVMLVCCCAVAIHVPFMTSHYGVCYA